MFERFGPRSWWPAKTPFEVVVGAVLTQNTSWKNVERAITNLERNGCLSLEGVLGCKELPRLIRPSGYYNVKARRLRALCEWIEEGGGLEAIFDLSVCELRKRLLSVKGIGEETADSIILYAAKRPSFVIDAYTRRVLLRVGLISGDEPYAELQRLFMDSLPKDVQLYNEYHALLVELGKNVCTKREPKCGSCPLKNMCDHAKGR
jgi:endonuclease-3 related protein